MSKKPNFKVAAETPYRDPIDTITGITQDTQDEQIEQGAQYAQVVQDEQPEQDTQYTQVVQDEQPEQDTQYTQVAQDEQQKKSITPKEAQETFMTRGRKGVKLPRINLAFRPSLLEYLRVMAAIHGMSITQYVNDLVQKDMEANIDIYTQAQKMTKEISGKKQG